MTEFGFELFKQQFSLPEKCLGLNQTLGNLQSTNNVPLQSKFGIQHRMSCREGGFIFIRHSDLRDASDVPDMRKDTAIEPKLTPLSGEELHGRKSNNSNDARIDIKTRSFLERGQRVFFDKGFRHQHLLS